MRRLLLNQSSLGINYFNFIIPQLNASHLTVTFLPYGKNKDVFIIPQLNAPHLTVMFLPYSKNKDVFIIPQLNAPHLTVTFLLYSKNKDVFIITRRNAVAFYCGFAASGLQSNTQSCVSIKLRKRVSV